VKTFESNFFSQYNNYALFRQQFGEKLQMISFNKFNLYS
jgi:hypothetical protein